jgi:hypothetical protein
MTVIPHPPYSPDLAPCDFCPFSLLTLHHFGTIEVIEEESQAVLTTLTEHDFKGVFKYVSSAGNGAYALMRTT